MLIVPVDKVKPAAQEGEAAGGVEKPAAGEREGLSILLKDDFILEFTRAARSEPGLMTGNP